MKRLAAETNAASFLRMWNLPETAKLEKQTFDKLALALVGATALEEQLRSHREWQAYINGCQSGAR